MTLRIRLPILFWLALASPGAPAADLAATAKAPAHVLEKALAGEAQNLLVLFGDPAMQADIASYLAARNLEVEDEAALAYRAQRYRNLKDRVLSRLKPGEADVLLDYRHIPMALQRITKSSALIELLSASEVAAVFEDRALKLHLGQSLPLIGQPAVSQTMGRTGAGATVAVLDTGVDYTRAEFGSCTAPGVPSGCRVVAALDTAPDDGARDALGHGTQVAGVVSATASSAGIAAIDVFDGNSAWSSDVIEGIDWAISNRSAYNIAAINMSLGDGVAHGTACTDPPGAAGDPFYTPINNARSAGMAVIASSGNEGFTTGIASPACVAAAVAVGAVYDANVGGLDWGICKDSSTAPDKVACYSNSGSLLDLLAPGSRITVIGATVDGTSFAAPHVAGAVAVLKSAFPGETPAQIENRLTASGKLVTDARNGIIKPRLDLLAAQGPPANDTFAAAIALSGTSGQTTGWNFNASKETGEPSHAGNGGGKSVWWNWTAPDDGQVSLDTHASGFNTLLAAYSGAVVDALSAVAGNDDDGSAGNASGLAFHATAGVIYRIAVDGYGGAAGAITLNWNFTPDPESDLDITLLDSPDPATAGSPLTYTLTVINHGPDAAAGVVAALTLDPGTAFISASSGCSASAGTITCDLGAVANGEMRVLTVSVNPSAAGTVSATAAVSSSTLDPVAGNDTASAQTLVEASSGSAINDTEVPLLPPWALLFLGAAVYAALVRRS